MDTSEFYPEHDPPFSQPGHLQDFPLITLLVTLSSTPTLVQTSVRKEPEFQTTWFENRLFNIVQSSTNDPKSPIQIWSPPITRKPLLVTTQTFHHKYLWILRNPLEILQEKQLHL